MPEQTEEKAPTVGVTGAPDDPAATAAKETGATPPTEIPAPDISQPGKTVHRANKLMKERLGGKGKGKGTKKSSKSYKKEVPKLFADGLNDQEVADVTGLSLDEVRELRQNPWGHKHPQQIKPHKPKLEPKSKLPKGYKHPVSQARKGETLKPSEFGKARAKELAEADPDYKAPAKKKKAAPKKNPPSRKATADSSSRKRQAKKK